IKDNLNNMKSNVSGTLRIGVSKYFAKYKIPKILHLFKKKHPEVEFQVVTGWSNYVYNLISKRDIHVGFIRGDYQWNGESDLLFKENICVVSKEFLDWEDLPKIPRISYETNQNLIGLINDWWLQNFDLPPNIKIEVDQVETCKEMIKYG